MQEARVMGTDEESLITRILGATPPTRSEVEPAPGSSVDTEPAEGLGDPRRVMLRVEIQSKLGFGPSEHRSSKPWAGVDAVPSKRARLHRRHM